jgi:sugar (pentulose or hexulose) kinase
MGVTLFWWNAHGLLPAGGTACFIGDYLASELTGCRVVSDPSNAASSGLLDVRRRCWDGAVLEALGLPVGLFPEIREADQVLGHVVPAAAAATGLAAGLPVFVALGDSQSAFLGSVEDRREDVLVNVGTGAQVMTAIDHFAFVPPLETRPLPRSGNLLVSAQLCGGRAYAVLERFFHGVLRQLGGLGVHEKLYDHLNRLADGVSAGSDGLRCRPLFTGTRAEPELRASWTGMSPENFTAAHMARALLEGIAEVLSEDYVRIGQAAGKSYRRVIGSGNALRKNPVLCRAVAERIGLPLRLLPHEEEAAVGAARLAVWGAGLIS